VTQGLSVLTINTAPELFLKKQIRYSDSLTFP